MSFFSSLKVAAKKYLEVREKVQGLSPGNRIAESLGLDDELEKFNKLHNPQQPYGDNKRKARGKSTPAYRGKGKMGMCSR